MRKRYTASAEKVLENAGKEAVSRGMSYVGTEHLLLALIKTKGVAAEVLRENAVNAESLEEMIQEMDKSAAGVLTKEKGDFTPRVRKVIEQSVQEAEHLGTELAGTEHLLIALLKETECIAVRLLGTVGINLQKLYMDSLIAAGQDMNTAKNEFLMHKMNKSKSTTPVLDQYSRDLTEYARNGKLDPVIGRDREIDRLVQILSRRTKNNPCLIGDPGVGKTAIVEGLALKIAEGEIPEIIQGKRVLTLDLSGMVAGSKYRGEFEERIKRALKEVTGSGNILLFIDEIHTIIGAGGAEGAIDAANILKPSLARGEIQLIGATTREEYRKYIEKDAALERRFQPVEVNEPDEAGALDILKGLRPCYEEHHQVQITDGALVAAVKMTERYVNDRFLPDKAIDVIDEASARAGLSVYLPTPELSKLEASKRELEQKKEDAIIAEDFALAGEIKRQQKELQLTIDQMHAQADAKRQKNKLVVTENEVAEVIADWTKIPVQKLQEAETERLKHLEEILHERVVGQEEAVKAVAKAVRRGRVGMKDPNRPIGSFLFLGPTGVGKTEVSKALAEAVFGNEESMIRVDMSEYMEKHSVSKMIGSPPGYVGHEDGGQLSEKVRRNPFSVILFDEIEKAHPDVFNILLQVLDDGHITDSQGRKVDFKNTIIIMTSNAGAQSIIEPKKLGFGAKEDEKQDHERMKASVMEEVKRIFKPEFLNRIDETIVFRALNKDDMKKIIGIMVRDLQKRCKEQLQIDLVVREAAKEFIVEKAYDRKYGARPLRRKLQDEVEDRLADALIRGEIHAKDRVIVTTKNKEIIVSKDKK